MGHFEEILNRIHKNQKKREPHLNQLNVEAYRLYDRDIPAYPYIIDRYGDYFFVYERGKKEVEDSLAQEHRNDIIAALEELFSISAKQIIFKTRDQKRGKTQYDKLTEYHSENKDEEIIIEERGVKFIIKLYDYLDTGLFLDHRPMRSKIKKMSRGKKMLNLFSYTSSVSLYAALGGAQTTSVDKSKNYLDWSKRNFVLNGINPKQHSFVAEDSLSFLKECKKSFDIIFIDPPTFSNEKKKGLVFEVEKNQVELITSAMSLLNPKGVLFFSTNKRTFQLDNELQEKFICIDLTKKTIPFDFEDKKIHYCFQFQHRGE